MLPLPRFALHSPTRLDEAVRLLQSLGPDTQIIAGGTDLLPNMKQGLMSPRNVVSLQRVEALQGITIAEDRLRIGSMTTLDAMTQDVRIREGATALAEAVRSVGGPHHRRMGTLGGNICLDTRCRYYNQTYFWRESLGFCLKKDGTVCHVVSGGRKCVAAASNDSGAALISLNATIDLLSTRGLRTLAAREFFTADGIRNTVRADDEIVSTVTVPISHQRRSAYEKLRRRNSIDFPLLSVAVCVDFSGENIDILDITVSALAARPRRLSAAQNIARGTPPSRDLITSLAQAAWRECRPLDNVEGDVTWRHEMVPVLVEKALHRALFATAGHQS